MDGVYALLLRQRDDAFHIQVRLDGPFALADQVGFIRLETVQCQPVFLRINGDGAQPEFVGCAEYTDSDLAAIQCKQFFHGGANSRITTAALSPKPDRRYLA